MCTGAQPRRPPKTGVAENYRPKWGVSLVGVFLVLRIAWEVVRRRMGVTVGDKASDEDWK